MPDHESIQQLAWVTIVLGVIVSLLVLAALGMGVWWLAGRVF